MLDTISQIAIPILSVLALILVTRKNKWGMILGLASEPFWFITSYQHRQWGILILSFVYTCTWAYGVWNWFKHGKH